MSLKWESHKCPSDVPLTVPLLSPPAKPLSALPCCCSSLPDHQLQLGQPRSLNPLLSLRQGSGGSSATEVYLHAATAATHSLLHRRWQHSVQSKKIIRLSGPPVVRPAPAKMKIRHHHLLTPCRTALYSWHCPAPAKMKIRHHHLFTQYRTAMYCWHCPAPAKMKIRHHHLFTPYRCAVPIHYWNQDIEVISNIRLTRFSRSK
jgi:hypothetical protein